MCSYLQVKTKVHVCAEMYDALNEPSLMNLNLIWGRTWAERAVFLLDDRCFNAVTELFPLNLTPSKSCQISVETPAKTHRKRALMCGGKKHGGGGGGGTLNQSSHHGRTTCIRHQPATEAWRQNAKQIKSAVRVPTVIWNSHYCILFSLQIWIDIQIVFTHTGPIMHTEIEIHIYK